MGILSIIIKRLGLGVLTLFLVSIIIFLAVNMLPGDFAQALLGQAATPEAVAAIRADLGLDRPIANRYFDWLVGAARGDFGTSFAQANFSAYVGENSSSNYGSVATQLAPRFANTVFLASVTAVIAIPISLAIGILAALYRYSIFDRVANVSTLTSISSPEFFVAYILILVLAVLNPLLPSLSNIFDGMSFAERLEKNFIACADTHTCCYSPYDAHDPRRHH